MQHSRSKNWEALSLSSAAVMPPKYGKWDTLRAGRLEKNYKSSLMRPRRSWESPRSLTRSFEAEFSTWSEECSLKALIIMKTSLLKRLSIVKSRRKRRKKEFDHHDAQNQTSQNQLCQKAKTSRTWMTSFRRQIILFHNNSSLRTRRKGCERNMFSRANNSWCKPISKILKARRCRRAALSNKRLNRRKKSPSKSSKRSSS